MHMNVLDLKHVSTISCWLVKVNMVSILVSPKISSINIKSGHVQFAFVLILREGGVLPRVMWWTLGVEDKAGNRRGI